MPLTTISPLTLQLAPDTAAVLRDGLRLAPGEVEAIAMAVAAKLREPPPAQTIKQLAERLGRSPSFLYREIKKGRLRATRIAGDGEMVTTDADVSAWLLGK